MWKKERRDRTKVYPDLRSGWEKQNAVQINSMLQGSTFVAEVFYERGLKKDEGVLPRAYREHMGGHSYFSMFLGVEKLPLHTQKVCGKRGMLILS